MIPPLRPPTTSLAFVVRIRCQVIAKDMLEGKTRRRGNGAPWAADEIRELANRYADRQLATLERDAQIIACIGMPHLAIEGMDKR
jgi:hypothetical protein